jgi:hypothetical protein
MTASINRNFDTQKSVISREVLSRISDLFSHGRWSKETIGSDSITYKGKEELFVVRTHITQKIGGGSRVRVIVECTHSKSKSLSFYLVCLVFLLIPPMFIFFIISYFWSKGKGEQEQANAYLDVIEDQVFASGVLEGDDSLDTDSDNNLYDQAVALVLRERKVSASFIEECLKISRVEATSLIERMEAEGIVKA